MKRRETSKSRIRIFGGTAILSHSYGSLESNMRSLFPLHFILKFEFFLITIKFTHDQSRSRYNVLMKALPKLRPPNMFKIGQGGGYTSRTGSKVSIGHFVAQRPTSSDDLFH